MAEPLVTIGTYASPVDAHLARSRLEAAGIEAFVAHAELGPLSGGVELQVRESALEQAVAMLESGPQTAGSGPVASAPEVAAAAASVGPDKGATASGAVTRPLDGEREPCIVCGSSFVVAKEPPLLARVLLLGVIEVLPIPRDWLWRPRRQCGVCGHEWRPGESTGPVTPR